MIDTYKLIGILGLLFIIVGILSKNRKQQNILYIIGGLLLEIYSIYLQDYIFIILQMIFTLAALYDLIRVSKQSQKIN